MRQEQNMFQRKEKIETRRNKKRVNIGHHLDRFQDSDCKKMIKHLGEEWMHTVRS